MGEIGWVGFSVLAYKSSDMTYNLHVTHFLWAFKFIVAGVHAVFPSLLIHFLLVVLSPFLFLIKYIFAIYKFLFFSTIVKKR